MRTLRGGTGRGLVEVEVWGAWSSGVCSLGLRVGFMFWIPGLQFYEFRFRGLGFREVTSISYSTRCP